MNKLKQKQEWQLVKNPNTLVGFGAKCRGVILLNGDLYLENFSNNTIHNDILKKMYEMKVFPAIPPKNWTRKLPQESGFLTVQRYKETNFICIGESNALLYYKKDYIKNIKFYKQILDKAKIKNSNIFFSNLLIGIKRLIDKNLELSDIFNDINIHNGAKF